jgi:hypothetical protein
VDGHTKALESGPDGAWKLAPEPYPVNVGSQQTATMGNGGIGGGTVNLAFPSPEAKNEFAYKLVNSYENFTANAATNPYYMLGGVCNTTTYNALIASGMSFAEANSIMQSLSSQSGLSITGANYDTDVYASMTNDAKRLQETREAPQPLQTRTTTAPDGSQIHLVHLPNLDADGEASGTRDTTARHQSTGVPPAAKATESRATLEPTSYTPLKTTEMNSEQLALYVDIRKEAREVFAEALSKGAPTVNVERNGLASDQERFSNSTGQIVGLREGKLIQESARGQITAFDYGDLLVNAKDSVAFDAMAHQALTTGEPMNLSMQQGQVAMMPKQAFGQQQAMQLGVAELSLGR